MRNMTRTWIAGGLGLVICGVVGMLRMSLQGTPGGQFLDVAADVSYAAGVLILAVGMTREASVVARRPLGIVALTVVAVWPLLSALAIALLGVVEPQGHGSAWMAFGYLSLLIPTAAGLTAAMQIARAGIVPAPWKWAPLWVLGLHVLAWVLPQLIIASVGGADAQYYVGLFTMLSTLAFLAGTLGLGTLSLVLAARRRPASVDVFRSTPET
ncbi:hypothetical protein [Microbacterium aurantiacum]|uniref:hypothetical protein n=1 Tax=Microbacterium aurantiacum TaxID=162393 RepID=UPI004036C8B0